MVGRMAVAPDRPFLLAIAGGSGSGKTTLTRALLQVLGDGQCAVLDHDSYYKDLAHLAPEARAGTNFDHPDALDNELLCRHLGALRQGQLVYKPCYDFATHTRRHDAVPVAPRPVVIAEGILLLSVPELRAQFDLQVFCDAPADVRALRRLQRDLVERGRTVDSVCRQYLTTVRPMHEQFVEPVKALADLVLEWHHSPEQWATVLAAMVRGRRS